MTEVFMGQIMMTGFGFPPRGFAQCNGQLISIAQNQAMFAVLGVAYGGDGITTFALPDLRGRAATGGGAGNAFAAVSGVETVTLDQTQLPAHTHLFNALGVAGTAPAVAGALFSNAVKDSAAIAAYAPIAGGELIELNDNTLAPAGASLPHQNMQPFTVINFNIALMGVFPSRN